MTMATSPQHVEAEEESSKSQQEPSSSNHHTNGKEAHPHHITNDDAPPAQSAKKQSLLKRIWTKLGFSPLVVMIMVKPALAATISMAIYQSHGVASHYLNLGYLIIVISITTVPILPRGKFLLNLFLSVVSFLLPDFLLKSPRSFPILANDCHLHFD
jgi:cation transport ATPase